MSLSDVLNISITRSTTSVTKQGFGITLILSPNANIANRVGTYSSAADVAAAVCGGTASAEYLAALTLFSQNPAPTKCMLGAMQGNKILTGNKGTWTSLGSIACSVNGTPVSASFTTDRPTTMAAFLTQLKLLTTLVDTSSAYNSSNDILTIVPKTGVVLAITGITLTTGGGTETTPVLTASATENADTALTNIQLVDDTWYMVVYPSHETTPFTQTLKAAAWVEAAAKFFATAQNDANIVNTTPDTASLPALLQAAGYARTLPMYSGVANTVYSEAAPLGVMATRIPGTYTLNFKTLAGVTADALTETQYTVGIAKNCNVYQTVGGVSIFQPGCVADGEWADVIVGCDWIKANLCTNIFSKLVNNDKIPYTDGGIAVIEAEIRGVLQAAVDNGFLASYTVTVPLAANITTNDKNLRQLNGVSFTGKLAGAIHSATITGTVTV